MTTILIIITAALAVPFYLVACVFLIRRILSEWFKPTDRADREVLPRYRTARSATRSFQQPRRITRSFSGEVVLSANDSPIDFNNERRLLDDHFWWGTGRWEPSSTDSLLDSSPHQFGSDDTFESTQLSSSFDHNFDGSNY